VVFVFFCVHDDLVARVYHCLHCTVVAACVNGRGCREGPRNGAFSFTVFSLASFLVLLRG